MKPKHVRARKGRGHKVHGPGYLSGPKPSPSTSRPPKEYSGLIDGGPDGLVGTTDSNVCTECGFEIPNNARTALLSMGVPTGTRLQCASGTGCKGTFVLESR